MLLTDQGLHPAQEAGEDPLKPELMIDMNLVAGIEPVGDVLGIEVDGVFGHCSANGFVGCALIEELVDEAALGFRSSAILPRGLRRAERKVTESRAAGASETPELGAAWRVSEFEGGT